MIHDEVIGYKTLKNKWISLHNDAELRKKILRPEILDSWERSYQYGVQKFSRECTAFCTQSEYREALDKSRHLLEASLPAMEGLKTFVEGTGFIISLTDANAVTLKIIGDKDAMEWAKRSKVLEGSIWTDDLAGTNAGALCLSLARPISVFAYEHFSLFSIVAACSYAPIIEDGRVIGSIGMLAPYEKESNHTLGLVAALAKHIEYAMELERVSKYHQVVMESMSDGIMVVDSNSIITYMNKTCEKVLGLPAMSTIGSKIYNILSNNPDNHYFINIISQARTVIDEFIVLSIGKAKIRCNITCTPLHSSSFGTGSVIIIRENERIKNIVGNWIGRSAKMTFNDVVGKNPKFDHIIKLAKCASTSNSNVFLLGESGTGKDIIAQAMHNESPRKNNPFLAINCAALPRELIASELFGYEDGAFTGAKKGGNIGKFELADQGTIFLDEIGDMPIDMQVTLLRVLEEKSVIRLGGAKLIPVNVRIIAATNKNLEEEIERNRFRRDLYYRLGVIKLNIPPLRERRDDIIRLADHFLGIICQRFGKPLKKFTPETKIAFLNYDWPGNIREMQNVLEGAVQLAPNDYIEYDFVKEYFVSNTQKNSQVSTPNTDNDLSFTITDVEHQMIINYLKKNNYNKNQTAKDLGISRRTLYRKLQQMDWNHTQPNKLVK